MDRNRNDLHFLLNLSRPLEILHYIVSLFLPTKLFQQEATSVGAPENVGAQFEIMRYLDGLSVGSVDYFYSTTVKEKRNTNKSMKTADS